VLFGVQAESTVRERFTFGRVDRRISPYVVSHFAGSYLDAPEFISRNKPSSDSGATDMHICRLRDFARNLDGETERIRSDAVAGVVPPDFIINRTVTRMRAQMDKLPSQENPAASDVLKNEVVPRLLTPPLFQPEAPTTPPGAPRYSHYGSRAPDSMARIVLANSSVAVTISVATSTTFRRSVREYRRNRS
jgi:hypothetical protein